MSDDLAIQQAAKRLGLTEWGLRKAVTRGELRLLPIAGPGRLAAAEVERFRRARQAAALERLAARGTDLVQLARDTRRFLQPHPGDPQFGVSRLGPDPVAVFGAPALHAACLPEPTCGWCASVVAAQMLGGEAPAYGEAMRALLGEPCARDMERFARAELDKLAARVRPAGGGRSAGRSVSPAPTMRAEPRQAAREAPTAAAPVQDDDGRGLVARRLRETRARLKEATRSGDDARAIQLRLTLQSLTADAARVDGRDGDAPRGRKRCGTPVGTPCSCHTSDRRGQR